MALFTTVRTEDLGPNIMQVFMFRLSTIVTGYHTAHFEEYSLQVCVKNKSRFLGLIFTTFLVQHMIWEVFILEAYLPNTS